MRRHGATPANMTDKTLTHRTNPKTTSNYYKQKHQNGSINNGKDIIQNGIIETDRRNGGKLVGKAANKPQKQIIENGVLNGEKYSRESAKYGDSSDDSSLSQDEGKGTGKVKSRKFSFGSYVERRVSWLFEPEYFVPEKQRCNTSSETKAENAR